MKEILITSSVLILVLLLLRVIFAKKVSRRLIYGAWILVALRLLIPVQIGQLDFSVLTAAQPVVEVVEEQVKDAVLGTTPQAAYRDQVEHYIEKDQTVFVPQVQEQIRQELAQGNQTPDQIYDKIQQQFPEQEILTPEGQETVAVLVGMENTTRLHNAGMVLTTIWIVGIVAMAVWFVVVNTIYSRKLKKDRQTLEVDCPLTVYVSENAASPCLMGLFRPVIYLTPSAAASEETMRHVLAHELTHRKHGDHIWSLVRCVCLCVYWFHPLVWVAAWCSRRDCELACDEGAMKTLAEEERIAYGKSLVDVVCHASAPAKLLYTATSMNERDKQLKERVNFIVKKRKNSIFYTVCLVLIFGLCGLLTMAGCTSKAPDPELIFDIYAENHDSSEGEVAFVLSEFGNLEFMRDGAQYHVKRGDRWDWIVMNGRKVIAADLNGDGKRELVSSTSVGSGYIDNRIYVYDIVNDMYYCLERRMEYDFDIVLEDGKLVAQRFAFEGVFEKQKPIDTGELKIQKGQLYYICGDEKVQGVVENVCFNMELLQNKMAEFQDLSSMWFDVYDNDATRYATQYYIERHRDALQSAIVEETETRTAFDPKCIQDKDMVQYLMLIGYLSLDNLALGFPARYVYVDPQKPEQIFICTELRDTKYDDIGAYYEALTAGKCKKHKETYVIRMDEHAIYRWGESENLYDSLRIS